MFLSAWSPDRRQPLRTPPPLCHPEPRLLGGGFLRGPQLDSAFLDESWACWFEGPRRKRLGRKSAFPSTPTQSAGTEWGLCEQRPPTSDSFPTPCLSLSPGVLLGGVGCLCQCAVKFLYSPSFPVPPVLPRVESPCLWTARFAPTEEMGESCSGGALGEGSPGSQYTF